MNNMETILIATLVILIFLVLILIVAFIATKAKEKKEDKIIKSSNNTNSKDQEKTKIAKEYDTNSIFSFMEFEELRDNMIIQKKGKRFLMAIECQGVNYDLMSEVEKVSTEQGFSNFLNTLKDPIQIYIQTRTVNLEKNIQDYKVKLNKIKDKMNLKEYNLKQYEEKEHKDESILREKRFEALRERNLYTYGKDVIADTEKMSLNKNVLKKKYYIIIKYFYEASDADSEDLLSEEEIRDTAFSNLYTRAASMIRVLSAIGIVGKALNTFELVDLLYNAYNRDDSEVFGIERAIDSGFNDIYIDSQSVIDKKIEILNKEIEKKAQENATQIISRIYDEREQELNNIEENIDSIIEELAKQIIADENTNIPDSIRKKAIKEIEEKGERKTDGEKEPKKTTRKHRAS